MFKKVLLFVLFMVSLPTVRCTPARAFKHSGVDYAGQYKFVLLREEVTIHTRVIFACLFAWLLEQYTWRWSVT